MTHRRERHTELLLLLRSLWRAVTEQPRRGWLARRFGDRLDHCVIYRAHGREVEILRVEQAGPDWLGLAIGSRAVQAGDGVACDREREVEVTVEAGGKCDRPVVASSMTDGPREVVWVLLGRQSRLHDSKTVFEAR